MSKVFIPDTGTCPVCHALGIALQADGTVPMHKSCSPEYVDTSLHLRPSCTGEGQRALNVVPAPGNKRKNGRK